jgi:hypothetical protein
MSEGEVLVSGGEASENGEFIFRRLPPWMPRTESDGNFKLLDVVGRGFDRLDGDIAEIDEASSIQTAKSKRSIEEIAKIIDEPPRKDESLEEYKVRAIASFQKISSEGSLGDLFSNISTLLDISVKDVEYEDVETNGEILLSIPSEALGDVALSRVDFSKTTQNQSAAGFRVNIRSRGTLTYVSTDSYLGSETYDNADLVSDFDRGHTGLDTTGDPKDAGGTYSGVLN